MTTHIDETWNSYYGFVARWYQRLLERVENTEEANPSDFDELNAYFILCWHLKDWLKNDRSVKVSNKEIEEYANKTDGALKTCGDIANAKNT